MAKNIMGTKLSRKLEQKMYVLLYVSYKCFCEDKKYDFKFCIML